MTVRSAHGKSALTRGGFGMIYDDKPPKEKKIVWRDGKPWTLHPTKGWERVKDGEAPVQVKRDEWLKFADQIDAANNTNKLAGGA